MKEYYVYVFLDNTRPGHYIYGDFKFDHEPFYIGKGTLGRMYHSMFDKRTFKSNKIKSIKNKGGEVIKYKIYENLGNLEALELEKVVISKIGRRDLGNGPLTNQTDGGDGRLTSPHTEETKRKISESRKLLNLHIPHTEDTKEKLRKINQGENNPMYGRSHTEEVKESHSLRVSGINHPMFGKTHNEETIEKIKENRNKSVNQEKLNIKSSEFNSKSILQYSLDGILITEFKSIKEASQKTGLSESLIGKTCRGIVKNPRKFIFKFKNSEDKVFRNSFLIKIGECFDNHKLIKRNKKSVIVEKDGVVLTLRLKEYPIFWEKMSIPF